MRRLQLKLSRGFPGQADISGIISATSRATADCVWEYGELALSERSPRSTLGTLFLRWVRLFGQTGCLCSWPAGEGIPRGASSCPVTFCAFARQRRSYCSLETAW